MKRSTCASVLTLVLLIAGCTHHRHHEKKPEALSRTQYVHVVVMWLKTPGNEQDRQTIITRARSFVGQIPGLVSVNAGVVKPSTRPVVDSTYDVGLVMIFDSEEALNSYGGHPVHQAAVREVITPLVDHYRVYDFIDNN